MVRKDKLSYISILIGSLVAGSFLSLTNFGLASADTNLKFAVSECPIVSNGNEHESGKCPDTKTIESEGQRIGSEKSDTGASSDRNVVEQSDTGASSDRNVVEQSDTSMPMTSGLVNPFGP
jgi:hypothetical protein